MSKKRHLSPRRRMAERVGVRTYAVRHLNGHQIPPHAHDWHQLIYASEGVMWVQTAEGDWVVPPNRAVWENATLAVSKQMNNALKKFLAIADPSSVVVRTWTPL